MEPTGYGEKILILALTAIPPMSKQTGFMEKNNMKNIKIKFTFLVFALVGITISLLASCYQPSPLYGTWSDNKGNKIILSSDNFYIGFSGPAP